MAHTIEKDWITEAGFRAICLIVLHGERQSHRCGYVGVPEEHPLFKVEYGEQAPCITQEAANATTLGNKGVMIALTATCSSDGEGLVRRSPDIICDVHGGLTYSGGDKGYPVESDLWWFGFDCHHCDDGEIEPLLHYSELAGRPVRSLEYVERECERLASQLAEIK